MESGDTVMCLLAFFNCLFGCGCRAVARGLGVADWRSDDSGELTSSADRRLDKAIGPKLLTQLFGC